MKKMTSEQLAKVEQLSDRLRIKRLSDELKNQLEITMEIQRQLDLTVAKYSKKEEGYKDVS